MAVRKKRRASASRAESTVLAIDSNWDSVTRIVYEYREAKVYPYLAARGLKVVRRQGALARRHYVAPEAQRPSVRYLTGVGHGFHDTYLGDYSDVIFKVGEYSASEVKDKLAHFVSCQTAQALGPDFVRHGAQAYFGYDEDFTFMEEYSDEFLECDSEIDLALADGDTATRADQRARAKYDAQIAEFLAAGKIYVAATLQYNRDHLRSPVTDPAWGKPNATLYKTRERLRRL
jgi:hypothetical protein